MAKDEGRPSLPLDPLLADVVPVGRDDVLRLGGQDAREEKRASRAVKTREARREIDEDAEKEIGADESVGIKRCWWSVVRYSSREKSSQKI
jgi:hypothetical protein